MQWQLKAPEDMKRLINASIVEFSMNIEVLLFILFISVSDRVEMKIIAVQTEYDLQVDINIFFVAPLS